MHIHVCAHVCKITKEVKVKKSGTLNGQATGEFNTVDYWSRESGRAEANPSLHAVLQVQHICAHENI